jgi:hypothetical protein
MKYERICTVPRGQVIEDGDDGYTVKVIAENLSDEMTLQQESILELEKTAIEGINAIIADVEAATGRTLCGIKNVQAHARKEKKFRPKLKSPEPGHLREHMYALGMSVCRHWDFEEEDRFIDWVVPILRSGFQEG